MKKFPIETFNKKLLESNQRLYAIKITPRVIELSNEVEVTDELLISKCKLRILKGDSIWAENFDKMFADDIYDIETENKIKSELSARGGVKCQELHGDRLQTHLPKVPWNKGKKGGIGWSRGLNKSNDERFAKMSRDRMGKGNPCYGRVYTREEREYKSKLMKDKILKGEFTPNSNNRNTHRDSHFNGKKYRSSWEALYQYFDPDAQYEKLRIPYTYNDKEFIYIVDFINHKTKTAIEVKPMELTYDDRTICKLNSLKQWCKENNFIFTLVDYNWLVKVGCPDDLSQFDDKTIIKIKKIYKIQ